MTEQYYPKDLITNPTAAALAANAASDKNNFTVVVPNLKIDSGYTFQFKYVFEDGSESTQWSPSYRLNTITESVPAAPTVAVSGGAGFIQVSLPTFPANASRVDVRIAGGIFGDGTKVADSFSAAGTKTIAAPGSASPGLQYIVTLLTVTPSKVNGDPSSPTTVYVTDPSATLAVTSPQDPFAPTVRAGLASVIVEWSGKKTDGADLTTTGFSGAKVHIGTAADFTPNADNWVHTLNFANGSNRVSIGVGSVINKTAGTTLQYGTDYYIKLVTTNASGTLSNAVSASNNPVSVAKLPASEISTGILTADASITAGVSGGQRVVMSGSTSPFVIYGTDGTTKLLEYLASGTEGTLSIKGSGAFTGNITGASGTFSGNISASNGLFSVNNGILTAQSGTIGGWNITGSVLESSAVSSNRISLNPATPKISLISGGVEKITIDPVEGIKHSSGSFSLTPNGALTASNATITGGSISLTSSISSGGLFYGDDSGLSESNDQNQTGGQGTLGSGSTTATLTIDTARISSNSILSLQGASYTEIISGGTQSAMFSNTRSSLIFTEGLYLGDTSSNIGTSTTAPTGPWITVEGRMRLRKGAPLLYPGGTAGAYIRNIYIKQTTSTPAATTGHVGDIFITY